jgi:hypothetical protein
MDLSKAPLASDLLGIIQTIVHTVFMQEFYDSGNEKSFL